MALSQSQGQLQTLRISPQQIQYIKLLQLQGAEIQSRVDEELQSNPALEQSSDDPDSNLQSEIQEEIEVLNEKSTLNDSEGEYGDEPFTGVDANEIDYTDQIDDNREIREETYEDSDYAGLNLEGDGNQSPDDDRTEKPIRADETLEATLLEQLGFQNLDDKKFAIGQQLIGTLDDDGYMRRPLEAISDDLAFGSALYVDLEEIEEVLFIIQKFDPAGIAARNLQECLLIQLKRKKESTTYLSIAKRIITDFFEEFTRKHYDRIQARLNLSTDEIKSAILLITKLNPRPGGGSESMTNAVIPDFIVSIKDGDVELQLHSRNAPELRINPEYEQLLKEYSRAKDKATKNEATPWIRNKIDSARWFMDAIKQRQQTLLITMTAIINYQKEFFYSGDDSKLRPMILQDIADMIKMDISTVSRVANSKYVQTDYGTFSLKHFFSEGISQEGGEDVSNKGIKQIIRDLIKDEDKNEPLSDDKLVHILNESGYYIARRTVAKYRESMNMPVARLRKEL
jgi:RNA polymerase sigma-54 factor